MADNYDYLNRAELIVLLQHQEQALREWKIKSEPADEQKKTTHNSIKNELEEAVRLLKEKLKSTNTPGQVSNFPGTGNQQVVREWTKAQKRQTIMQDVASVGKLNISNIERWITEIDQIYILEIRDDDTFTEEFVKILMRQLPTTIYSQLNESGKEIKSWTDLRSYLVLNFGSKISIYQHLTKLNDLQLQRNQNVSTFAAQLEEQTYIASLHISKKFKEINNTEITAQHVFKMLGALILSIRIRSLYPKIYHSMVKDMDKHWTATSLAAECQDFLDRLGPDSSYSEVYLAKQDGTSNAKKERDILSLEKLKEKVKHEVCKSFARTGTCKYGDKCFRRHIEGTYDTEDETNFQ